MFGIRYHIVSLIAVFLALSLGIILGTVIVDKGIIVEQQKALVENLQKEFSELRQTNRDLQKELNQKSEFEETVFDQVITDVLERRDVAVIATTNISESIQNDIGKTLTKSGAETYFIEIKKSNFDKSNNLEKISNFFLEENLSQDELWEKVLTRLATDISSSNDHTFINALEEEKIVYSSGNVIIPTNLVVIYGGREKDELIEYKDMDKILIETFSDYSSIICGTEATKVDKSFIRQYQSEGLSTVDNVDTIPGQVALVYVLAGNSGRYGVKSSAQSLLPPIKKGQEL